MKTLVGSSKFLSLPFLLLALATALSGCSKSGDSGSSSATASYGYVNGQCYNLQNNTPMASNYCAGGTVNGVTSGLFRVIGNTCSFVQTGQTVNMGYCTSNPFISQNGTCLDSLNGNVQVSAQFCTTTSTYGATSGVGVCSGNYAYSQGGQTQMVQCGTTTNCRGYTLYNMQTGQTQTCQ